MKIFNNHGLLSVIEYLDLEHKTFGLLSYVFLLDFAYEHNANIIQKINKPNIWNSETHLCLANNTINQLNLVDHHLQNVSTKYSSLFAVINNTSTNIGKRLLRDTLLNPIINCNEIERRYNIIDSLIKDCNYKQYETYLNKISDLERLHRKLSLDLLQPADFSSLDISYDNVKELFKITDSLNCKVTQSLKPSNE